MNKLVKGSIAAAAGIALLLGGAGTFALWSDGATLNPGTVTAGELDLVANADGAWVPALTYVVPGDVTTYTETFDISAVGDTLNAEITTNISSIVGSIAGATYDVTFTVTDSLGAPVVPAAGVYSLTEGAYSVSAEIVVTFDESATGGMNDSIDFDGLEVNVAQVII